MANGEMPRYQSIAYDIATRIAKGDIPLRKKLSGRSMLASVYGVSPETIRRALKQLVDMKVVDVLPGSGVYPLSVDNARRFIEGRAGEEERESLENRFRELVNRQNDISLQILDIASEMTRSQTAYTAPKGPLPYHEAHIEKGSRLIGKSIGQLKFWQSTGATIVGIRRANRVMLSPGPLAELYDGDSIIYVGDAESVKTVEALVGENNANGGE